MAAVSGVPPISLASSALVTTGEYCGNLPAHTGTASKWHGVCTTMCLFFCGKPCMQNEVVGESVA